MASEPRCGAPEAPSPPSDDSHPPAERPTAPFGLGELERAVQAVEPAALFVLPRILRRVIKQDCRLTGFAVRVPHRKSYVIAREPLLEIVDLAELGLVTDAVLPPQVILLPQPDPSRLAELTAGEALSRYWRLLVHARVHAVLQRRVTEGRLDAAAVRRRIHRIGETEFDEIRTVLRQEGFLLPPRNDETAYVEFAAVYVELKHFAPSSLPRCFPSIEDFGRIDGLLAEDLDAAALVSATRPPGAPDPVDHCPLSDREEWPAEPGVEEPPPAAVRRTPSERKHRIWMRRAQREAELGNVVGSAIYRARAERWAPPRLAEQARTLVHNDVERLARRLHAALDLGEPSPQPWHRALLTLVRGTPDGIWTVEARLLYDLQKVCVDNEREISTVDVVEWALSLGRRPIRRALPTQRDVLTSKHLRSAARRLAAVRLTDPQRQQLGAMLRAAAQRVEARLRGQFRPLITDALDEVGLTPQNVPERVAQKKLVEELLDKIVERGFLAIGDLRDALSGNNLKLPDFAPSADLLRGDPLLRADRRLSVSLDGVYRPGEFYMRWLQRLSSFGFGTRFGRFLTRYATVPFGGAYLVLAGLYHLIEEASGVELPLRTPLNVILLGLLLLGLMHWGQFRGVVWQGLKALYRFGRGLLIDLPQWVLNLPWLRGIIDSRWFRWPYRFVLKPLAWTALVWWIFPLTGTPWQISAGRGLVLFLTINLLLNSRWGRSCEEMVTDWLVQSWQRYGLRLITGLFYLVVDAFRTLLENFERVLYTVDEWLRFRSGESRLTLAGKAVLATVWFAVVYVIRFCVNLLLEPQINPIKHFPVVTVAHKLLLPAYKPFGEWLAGYMEAGFAVALATVIIWCIPGIFGFLVWELKENWRLYRANRRTQLGPIMIGSHGEGMSRLLKVGFHSGTLPKRFAKLRRAERKARASGNWQAARKHLQALRHVELSLRRYVERELLELLAQSKGWDGVAASVGEIRLGAHCVRIGLHCPSLSSRPLRIALEVQSGWLLARVMPPGWADALLPQQRGVLGNALVGLYKTAGVEVLSEQVAAAFPPPVPAFAMSPRGLVVWPDAALAVEMVYALQNGALLVPQLVMGTPRRWLPALERSQVAFREVPVPWQRWVEVWQQDQSGRGEPDEILPEVPILPAADETEVAERY